MSLAWVNYESYDKDNKVIPRWKKSQVCYNYILELKEKELISETNFPYLLSLTSYIDNNINTLNTEEKIINFIHWQIWSSKKALFKIK
jgi:hypothetical protein